ncbi:MAG: Uma2 family endonuclease [Raineya sp.]|nr:Uma2 family endonuclease [Raineya sp.]
MLTKVSYTIDDFLKFKQRLGELGGFEFAHGLIWDKEAGKPVDEAIIEQILADDFDIDKFDFTQPFLTMPTQKHDRVVSNLLRILMSLLNGDDYFVYSQKTGVIRENDELGSFREPDVVVVETTKEQRNKYHKVENPCVVIEVLSKSTQRIDLGEKVLDYQELASVKSYLIVWQNKMQVVIYNRLDEKRWEEIIYDQAEQNILVPSLGIEIPMQEIYQKVDLNNA